MMNEDNYEPTIASPLVGEIDILFIQPTDVPCCLGPRQQTLNDEMRDVVMSREVGNEKNRAGPQPKETKVYIEEQETKLVYLDELISRHQASVSLHEKEIRRLRSLMASCRVRKNQRQADHAFADKVAYLAQLIKDPSKRKLI